MGVSGKVVVAGTGAGPLLRLTRPISFWGGVDPRSGVISDPRHPQAGAALAGRVVAVAGLIGSSSGSSVLLELVAAGAAPAALILGEADAITALGALVARELDLAAPPIIQLPPCRFDELPDPCRVTAGGLILAA